MSYVVIAVGVGSALYSGDQAKQSGKIAGIYAEGSAQLDEMQALETARIIRRAGYRQVGAAKAAYAGAGVKVGEGTAQQVQDEMTAGVEHDAFQAILEGNNRAFATRHGGEMAVQAGKDAMTASVVNAAGTALGGYNAAQRSGWKTNNYPKG